MKKSTKFAFGGIKGKVFGLVIVTIVLMMAAYTGVIAYQSGQLTSLVKDTGESQKKTISDVSEATMKTVLESNMTQSTNMQAYIAEDLFGDAVRVVNVVADYTEKLFADPASYPRRDTYLPDKDKNGEISVQVLTEEGVDLTDATVADELGLIGNLTELMAAVYANAGVDSCYAALPSGVMLLVDDHSASKFDDEGNVIPIPITKRLWYTGAAAAGRLHFTDVTTDLFTGEISIMCSLPVYNGEDLVAVIGADLFLNEVSTAVNGVARDGSFICIVNNDGHVLFSPEKDGTFMVQTADKAKDLRDADNNALSAFIRDALNENTGLRLIDVDGEQCYVVGAPIGNVGWTVISVVEKSLADRPATEMLIKFNAIQTGAMESFYKGATSSTVTIVVLIVIAFVLAATAAMLLSRRIVKPLTTMTDRVRSLGGEDLQFRMEDAYRTRDEIQVLAESFAMLSGKTLQYIAETQRVTAEKERIGTELSLATRIQADMLPNIFPAFPERRDFDVYASMQPAKEVGGDFYDFFLVDDDRLALVIADVSGKGVPAALFMMIAKTILQNYATTTKNAKLTLEAANAQICKNNREDMFVTVWLGILDLKTGVLTAANAGHEYPVIKHADGSFEVFKDKHGFVIGSFETAKYKEYEIQLEKGAKIFLYTDGVAEATNAEKQLFGLDRMVAALRSAENGTPKDVLEAVDNAVVDFVKDAPQFDDLTMLCVEYKGE